MRRLNQSELLSLWEAGSGVSALDRGLLAVRAVETDAKDDAADWPLGRRNRALAEWHAGQFGTQLRGWTECPACDVQLEFDLAGWQIAEARTALVDRVTVDGVSYRLPTSRDLAAVLRRGIADQDATVLLERCCLTEGVTGWSEAEVQAVEAEMAAADPLSEIQLHFDCPGCGLMFEEGLDLVTFVWAEVESRARRLLASIHTLARAYGWSESAILGLSPARREAYLAMVRG